MKTVRVRDQEERQLVLGLLAELRMPRWQRVRRNVGRTLRVWIPLGIASVAAEWNGHGVIEGWIVPIAIYFVAGKLLDGWIK